VKMEWQDAPIRTSGRGHRNKLTDSVSFMCADAQTDTLNRA